MYHRSEVDDVQRWKRNASISSSLVCFSSPVCMLKLEMYLRFSNSTKWKGNKPMLMGQQIFRSFRIIIAQSSGAQVTDLWRKDPHHLGLNGVDGPEKHMGSCLISRSFFDQERIKLRHWDIDRSSYSSIIIKLIKKQGRLKWNLIWNRWQPIHHIISLQRRFSILSVSCNREQVLLYTYYHHFPFPFHSLCMLFSCLAYIPLDNSSIIACGNTEGERFQMRGEWYITTTRRDAPPAYLPAVTSSVSESHPTAVTPSLWATVWLRKGETQEAGIRIPFIFVDSWAETMIKVLTIELCALFGIFHTPNNDMIIWRSTCQ